MSPGVVALVSASSVARTMLYGLLEPRLLATMSVTPITSKTARIGPPAMMPVPAGAGAISTLAAPCSPRTLWWIEPFFSATLTMLRRAASIAFWTATGTSRALPLPMPMRPSPSPTTVSAAKPRIRPPFTTLVTRLTAIIFSRRPSPRSSCCCGWRGLDRCCAMYEVPWSELEAALAGGVGQRFYAAVKTKPGAIERDFLDPERLRALGDAFADHRRGSLVGAVPEILAHVGLDGRCAGEHLVASRRDDLRVDMRIRAADDEAHRALLGDAQPRLSRAADSSFPFIHRISVEK